MANLYLMCGVPGSGKSTFLKNKINRAKSEVISRDEIRFSLLGANEDYFSHENEVYKILWERTNEALAAGKDVFVDQTSLTPRSRKWLVSHVTGYDTVNLIWINEPLETCLERNELRRGTKAYVPRSVLRRMYNQFVIPTINEGFHRIYRYNSQEDRVTYEEAPSYDLLQFRSSP